MPNPAFWNKRRVFLTGHTGFKGSWLSLWLRAPGADVTGYALDPPTDPNLFVQARVEGMLGRSIRGDIRDFSALKNAIDSAAPDVVIHMAAQSVVRRSYEDPIETYSSNVMGTLHVFEADHESMVTTPVLDAHGMDPTAVFAGVAALGGKSPYTVVVGCEAENVDEGMGLSASLTEAVDDAVDAVLPICLCRNVGIDHDSPQFSGAERNSLASRALTGMPLLPQAVRM